jgi:hypothetical protein
MGVCPAGQNPDVVNPGTPPGERRALPRLGRPRDPPGRPIAARTDVPGVREALAGEEARAVGIKEASLRHAAIAAADEGAGEGIRLAHDCVVDELLLALLVGGAGEDAVTDHGERGRALERAAALDAEQVAAQLPGETSDGGPPGASFFRVWSTCRVRPVPSGPVPKPLPRSLANATMWPWPFEVRPGEFAIAVGEQVNHSGCDWDDVRLAACDARVFIIIFAQ